MTDAEYDRAVLTAILKLTEAHKADDAAAIKEAQSTLQGLGYSEIAIGMIEMSAKQHFS